MLFNKLKNLFKSREKIERAIPKIKLKKDNIRNCEIVLDREELLSKIPKNSIIAEIGVDEGDFSSKILNKAQPKESIIKGSVDLILFAFLNISKDFFILTPCSIQEYGK